MQLCLGVEICGSKEHAARHGLPGLWALLAALPRTHWPAFLRGDCGYGNEALLVPAEARTMPYLFKLRHTAKVKLLVAQMQRTSVRWQDAGGWLGRVRVEPAAERLDSRTARRARARGTRHGPLRRARPAAPRPHPADAPRDPRLGRRPAPWAGKIAVLVTSLDERACPAVTLARLYPERADAEPSGAR